MANELIKHIYDALESTLLEKGRLAGVFGHPTMVGDAREFFVKEILGSILPENVIISSGKVIDSHGSESKQIDIIIADQRFPRYKIANNSIFHVEGVLATIEVKSTLKADELSMALENCSSVLRLNPIGEHPHEANKQINWYKKNMKIPPDQAKAVFDYRLRPATYIYGYKNEMAHDTFSSKISHFVSQPPSDLFNSFIRTPRLICAGNSIAIANDGRFNMHNDKIKSVNKRAYELITYFQSDQLLRWLALHLSYNICGRLGARNHMENFEYRTANYYPILSFFNELTNKQSKVLTLEL